MRLIPNIQTPPSPTDDDDDDLLLLSQSATGIPPRTGCNERWGRGRQKWQFWLSHDIPAQCDLIQWLDSLKARRQFAPTLRKALTLYRSLLAGQVDVLVDLFPNVVARLKAQTPDMQAIIEERDFLRQLVMAQQGSRPAPVIDARPAPPPLPDDDDDDVLDVRADANAGQAASQNFLDSMMRLQG